MCGCLSHCIEFLIDLHMCLFHLNVKEMKYNNNNLLSSVCGVTLTYAINTHIHARASTHTHTHTHIYNVFVICPTRTITNVFKEMIANIVSMTSADIPTGPTYCTTFMSNYCNALNSPLN